MWNRRDIDFIQSQDLPWTMVPLGDFGAGELQKVLSADSTDGSRTILLRLHNPVVGRLHGAADIYVLEGDGELNGYPLRAGHYFYVAPGGWVNCRPGVTRTTLYAGLNGSSLLDEVVHRADAVKSEECTHIDTEELDWSNPDWGGERGTAPAVFAKILRRSASEEVRLIAMLPGHKSDAEEQHDVSEESFRLSGDLLFGERGLMVAGAYFFHSARLWHCPSGSRYGSMSIVRTSGPLTTNYRSPKPGSNWHELAQRGYANYRSPALGPI